MRNLLLFIDGAVYAAIWTTGPLLLPSLIYQKNATTMPREIHPRRPLSAEEALSMTGTTLHRIIGGNTINNNATTTSQTALNIPRGIISSMTEKERMEMMSSTTGSMVLMLLVFLAGRALGNYVMDRRHGMYSRLILLFRRLPCTTRPMQNIPPWRVACSIVGAIVSLFMLNLGFGIFTFGGWMAIRFLTALISGGLVTWGKDAISIGGSGVGDKEKGGFGGDERQVMSMEEGQPLLSATFSGEEGELGLSTSSQQLLEKEWLNWYWLTGVATSGLVGGSVFYPLNRLMVAFHPHERIYVLVLVIGICGVVDRCLVRYYSKNRPSATLMTSSSKSPSFSDAGIVGGNDSSRFQVPNDGSSIGISRSSSVSTVQRRKTPQQQLQQRQMQSSFDDEQQITFYDHQTESHQRQRLNSNDTFESEQFFDCLDDIELDSEHNTETAAVLTLSHENQIAIYSGRRVIYPDGTPAAVPAGESLSTIPPGYLALYKNDRSKAQSKYQLTQQWRQKEQIYSIHARPHTWFPKIKTAYPHVIHGFTSNGMPVVYESPGRMNLKELFKNGCHVNDMIFHYCYLMEYLSNMESILTELHSNDQDSSNDDDDWQNELASYAHAKQSRLQNDSVPFGFCVVMDISGATPTSLSGDVMTYLKQAGETNSLHYPTSMRRCIAVQAPYWIGFALKAMKGVVPSLSADLLSRADTMEGGLKEWIDEDQIPVDYGGKSKFKLGEHPFERGLINLVERQGEVVNGETQDDSPVQDLTPLSFPPRPQLEKHGSLKQDSPASSAGQSNMSWEWDGLGSKNILTTVAILHFFVYVVVGSLEFTLPYWIIFPPIHGGMGYEAWRNGTAVFVSCCFNSWAIKRSRFPQLTLSTIEKSPLRGFRIGIGTSCFILMCVSLIPITSNSIKSTLGLLCFCSYLSLIFFGVTLGLLSLEYLRVLVIKSSEEGNISLGWMQARSAFGRIVGYICIAPIFRWSIKKELSFPLNASLFLCLLACICWLLYIVSFSLHTASPSHTSHTKRKQSQFMSAMGGWVSFIKEVVLVACADISFLTNELIK